MPPFTMKEIEVVKRKLILSLVVKAFERDMAMLEHSNLKMKHVYLDHFQNYLDLTTEELAKIKRVMRELGIKIYEEKMNKERIFARYVVRGYHHDFSMLSEYVKAEVEVAMRDIMKAKFGQWKASLDNSEIL